MSHPPPEPMRMCPMAATCQAMMRKPFTGTAVVIPGLVFIGLGILIVVYPLILVWLVGLALVLFGILMFIIAIFIRKVGARLAG